MRFPAVWAGGSVAAIRRSKIGARSHTVTGLDRTTVEAP